MKINKCIQILFLLLFLFFGKIVNSQNLVPNPGFEEYSICPDDGNEVTNCNYWTVFKESPDYFNSCALGTHVAIPVNWFGFQYPHSGNAYMGLATFNTSEFREFIGANLKNNLIIGEKYYVSMFVSLAFSNNGNMFIATNKLGLKCSTVPYNYWNPAPVNNSALFYTDSVITDTTNWVKLSGSFVADSAYDYIIIGNYFDNQHTDTISLNYNGVYAYYYIDDVCLTTDSLYNENWTGINKQKSENTLSIYPNPTTDKLFMNLNDNVAKEISVKIFNSTGQQLLVDKFKNYKLIEIDISTFSKGVYLLEIIYDNKLEYRKLIIK